MFFNLNGRLWTERRPLRNSTFEIIRTDPLRPNSFLLLTLWEQIHSFQEDPISEGRKLHVHPSFTISKWGLRGSKLYRYVFRDVMTYATGLNPDHSVVQLYSLNIGYTLNKQIYSHRLSVWFTKRRFATNRRTLSQRIGQLATLRLVIVREYPRTIWFPDCSPRYG